MLQELVPPSLIGITSVVNALGFHFQMLIQIEIKF